MSLLESIARDLRVALRQLLSAPGFTVVAVAMLALGIGVNAAVFTVANAVLFRGFRGIDRNDRILYVHNETNGQHSGVSYPDFEDWRAQARSFEDIGAVADSKITLNDQSGFPERYTATRITANGFRLLGRKPIMGRPFELARSIEGGDELSKPTIAITTIGPDYFKTLGARVLSGREFNSFDGSGGMPVVIVNRQFANQHWAGQTAIGERLRLVNEGRPGAWLTVVGVVSNIIDDPSRQRITPMIYLPYAQTGEQDMWVLVRNHSVILLIFAAMALLLASTGLYAVIAHSVKQRTQEIGIRIAVGAAPRDILALLFRLGMVPVAAGLMLGVAGSFAVNRILSSELVHVSPADPIAMASSCIVLVLSAATACWIPARRAIKVDPVITLRSLN